MKKGIAIVILFLMLPTLFLGCRKETTESEQKSQITAIGNPWSDWDSMEKAESAVGFSFGLPEVIADSYTLLRIRTMNKELLEVVYCYEDSEVCVRKQKGEGQDISGDYNQYDTCTETNQNGGTVVTYHNKDNNAIKQLIHYQGYSWSIVTADGFWGDSNHDFVRLILGAEETDTHAAPTLSLKSLEAACAEGFPDPSNVSVLGGEWAYTADPSKFVALATIQYANKDGEYETADFLMLGVFGGEIEMYHCLNENSPYTRENGLREFGAVDNERFPLA